MLGRAKRARASRIDKQFAVAAVGLDLDEVGQCVGKRIEVTRQNIEDVDFVVISSTCLEMRDRINRPNAVTASKANVGIASPSLSRAPQAALRRRLTAHPTHWGGPSPVAYRTRWKSFLTESYSDEACPIPGSLIISTGAS